MLSLTSSAVVVWALATFGVQAQSNKTSCGSLFVAFGYPGGNDIWCYPYVDADMGRYNAWYNGSTTITLTGNPDECPDETLGPLSNALAIGGMTVPDNSSLDRTTYDSNPFYFYMPWESGKNMSAGFQSSTDYYIEETQSWRLFATKSGDGYDVTGYWIGTLPTENSYSISSTKCWDGGDQWPVNWSKSSGDHGYWNVTGRLTPDSATWSFDMTWITSDDTEWHIIITFTGQAYTDGPRLVTTGDAPSTEGCLGCREDGSSATTSGTGSRTTSGASSSASSASGSSAGTGMKEIIDTRSVVAFGIIAAIAAMFL